MKLSDSSSRLDSIVTILPGPPARPPGTSHRENTPHAENPETPNKLHNQKHQKHDDLAPTDLILPGVEPSEPRTTISMPMAKHFVPMPTSFEPQSLRADSKRIRALLARYTKLSGLRSSPSHHQRRASPLSTLPLPSIHRHRIVARARTSTETPQTPNTTEQETQKHHKT